jgi:ribosomal protein L24
MRLSGCGVNINTKQHKRQMKHQTRIITDESQVPSGFVRLTEYRKDNPSDAKRLSQLHKIGEVEAVKLMRTMQDVTGPVWVNKAQADDALAQEKQQELRPSTVYTKNCLRSCEL